jgi:hypothetical protein
MCAWPALGSTAARIARSFSMCAALVEHDVARGGPWPEEAAEVIGTMSLKRPSRTSETPSRPGRSPRSGFETTTGPTFFRRPGTRRRHPLREARVERPPAADVVDGLVLALPVEEARRPGHEERLGDVDRERPRCRRSGVP